jgi:hypothetical protein
MDGMEKVKRILYCEKCQHVWLGNVNQDKRWYKGRRIPDMHRRVQPENCPECEANAPWGEVTILRDHIEWLIRRSICARFGHKWISADWGGPESGGIGVDCKRCGESHRHTLY